MKHVVKADGSVELVPFTKEEEARAVIDAEKAQKDTDRRAAFAADLDRTNLIKKLRTALPSELEAFACEQINTSGIEKAYATLLKLLVFSVRE